MIATEELVMHQEEINFCTASPFTVQYDFAQLNDHFETRSLDDFLEWSLCTFGDKVTQVTSFGPSGMVILDHLARLSPGIRIITIDTHFLFDETYALMEQVQQRYPIQLDIRGSHLTPDSQAKTYGPALWESAPDHCCHLRKVVPLGDALHELDAWITGLRRDQSPTRANMPLVTWDKKYDLVKLNPLASWNRGQVWSYILKHKIPYNPLHDQGFASIGCTHCTHPTSNITDERSGRWKGRTKTECGIHLA
ncbi:MAG: phosphoadenylyl-sulfate reductase [Anaerolineae bacterium]|nr:phosphoadenylyl-sulfate reductase [Anaerolineae bacterium]